MRLVPENKQFLPGNRVWQIDERARAVARHEQGQGDLVGNHAHLKESSRAGGLLKRIWLFDRCQPAATDPPGAGQARGAIY
ncbi:MAG: hypothetical protein ACJ8FK_03570, partial [Xanthobacteraceae bacterium]